MPELSRSFGIIIRMHREAAAPRHQAHFHAYYQDEAAVFTVGPVELLAGSLPRGQHDRPEHADSLKSCAEGWERVPA